MVVTVASVVVTHNLAIGVFTGVLLSAIFFAAKISKVHVEKNYINHLDKQVYKVNGQIFFASVTDFVNKFDYKQDVKYVEIDLTSAHLWDDSAIGALDKIEGKFEQNGVKVEYVGLNSESEKLKDKIGGLSKASGH
jgi:SulP family sulfate permease